MRFLGNVVTPILLKSSELEMQKISSFVANRAVSEVISDSSSLQNIFETVTSSDGTIQTIDFNPVTVNQILNVTTGM
ncbi:MAG: hypothetical protein K2I72_01565, partial [Bacilli bacterium]|nr:hypothetical protein [Bacilli bacterium]